MTKISFDQKSCPLVVFLVELVTELVFYTVLDNDFNQTVPLVS